MPLDCIYQPGRADLPIERTGRQSNKKMPGEGVERMAEKFVGKASEFKDGNLAA